MIKVLIEILSSLLFCNCEWHLKWHDEFDERGLIAANWDIENSGNRCIGER